MKKRTIDVPCPGGGVTTCRLLATFRARVSAWRLTFYALRLPPPFGGVSCTEASSRHRFSASIALSGERVTSATAITRGRGIVRAALARHGATQVLKGIAKARRALAALPEFRAGAKL